MKRRNKRLVTSGGGRRIKKKRPNMTKPQRYGEELPYRESMRPKIDWDSCNFYYSNYHSDIEKFLFSKIGEKWSEVYSQLLKRVPKKYQWLIWESVSSINEIKEWRYGYAIDNTTDILCFSGYRGKVITCKEENNFILMDRHNTAYWHTTKWYVYHTLIQGCWFRVKLEIGKGDNEIRFYERGEITNHITTHVIIDSYWYRIVEKKPLSKEEMRKFWKKKKNIYLSDEWEDISTEGIENIVTMGLI